MPSDDAQQHQPKSAAADRALIEQLIAETALYRTSKNLAELLEFVSKFRSFAPFNAMLLHIQKPGLTHAATARDWIKRFGRRPQAHARPLLILRSMGPVDFVFDVLDTEGKPLPIDAFAFATLGQLDELRFAELTSGFSKEKIELLRLDAGDGSAGWIKFIARSDTANGKHSYQLAYNCNHSPATRFVTLAHELAHLFLGHLGADKGRNVPERRERDHAMREVEAETAAYLVARRNDVKPRSETYLQDFQGSFGAMDIFAVMRAANEIEKVLGIGAHKLWEKR